MQLLHMEFLWVDDRARFILTTARQSKVIAVKRHKRPFMTYRNDGNTKVFAVLIER